MKRIALFTLLFCLLCGSYAYAAAIDDPVSMQPEPIMQVFSGDLANVKGDSFSLLDGKNSYDFIVTDETFIIKAGKRTPAAIQDFKEGTLTHVYALAMDPETAVCVISGGGKKGINNFFMLVANVEKTKDGVRVTDVDNAAVVTIPSKSTIIPYKTKNIVTADDIKVGSCLVVEYDVAAMSLPLQATSTHTIILYTPEEEPVTDGNGGPYLLPELDIRVSTQAGVVSVNGKEMPFGEGDEFIVEGEEIYIPLRSFVECIGGTISWDDATRTVTLDIGTGYNMTIDVDNGVYDGDMVYTKPIIRNGKTHIPLSFLKDLLNLNVTVNNANV